MAGPARRRQKEAEVKPANNMRNQSQKPSDLASVTDNDDSGGVVIPPAPTPQVLEFAKELLLRAAQIIVNNLDGDLEVHVGAEISKRWNQNATVFTRGTHIVMERELSGKLLPVQCLTSSNNEHASGIAPPSEAQLLVSAACAHHSQLRAMGKAKASYLITALVFRGGIVHLIRADITQDYINSLESVEAANLAALTIEISRNFDLHNDQDPGELVQRVIDVFTGRERRLSGGIW
ncbi:uncharacterized protein BDZ99DRAFT_460018 [Mytilinidion resinicola]|uniref:Uncharacterized protein n=1 Tax=Mytilinidion resinicola TaxID=574789 RepID=A0A6A6Z0X6_9PEZI|nr:uncharacterized protein BDZ99DRAFT_460018 [Mytilinidion resinicola]KAF2814353.1 hypothetical protein BDZ99DRAFT_460018 [Mytilinidion resinicola]